MGIESALAALDQREQKIEAQRRQRELALEQARFEADRARRQYDAIDPENRLVAAELEHRWNDALHVVQQREAALTALDGSADLQVTDEQRQSLLALADDLPAVWSHPQASAEIKKRILRTVVKEIVVYLEEERLRLLLHWQGGDHTELKVAKSRAGQHRWKTDVETENIIQTLARLMSDSYLAGLLNRLGKRTAKGHSWTRNRVCCFRNDHDIPVYIEGERQGRGELTLHEAAEALGVSPMTVRRLIKRKLLPAEQVCVGAPWVIHGDDLKRQAVQDALRSAPLTVNDKQQALNFQ
jgi:excisionase family DNA binding protein